MAERHRRLSPPLIVAVVVLSLAVVLYLIYGARIATSLAHKDPARDPAMTAVTDEVRQRPETPAEVEAVRAQQRRDAEADAQKAPELRQPPKP